MMWINIFVILEVFGGIVWLLTGVMVVLIHLIHLFDNSKSNWVNLQLYGGAQ